MKTRSVLKSCPQRQDWRRFSYRLLWDQGKFLACLQCPAMLYSWFRCESGQVGKEKKGFNANIQALPSMSSKKCLKKKKMHLKPSLSKFILIGQFIALSTEPGRPHLCITAHSNSPSWHLLYLHQKPWEDSYQVQIHKELKAKLLNAPRFCASKGRDGSCQQVQMERMNAVQKFCKSFLSFLNSLMCSSDCTIYILMGFQDRNTYQNK